MKVLPKAFAPMAQYKQWMCWKIVQFKGEEPKKMPVDPRTGSIVSAHDPAYWMDVDGAIAGAKKYDIGVSFVVSEKDPFFFLDIDHAHTPAGWDEIATRMCSTFHGCAIELSQSGEGLHIVGVGTVPGTPGCRDKIDGMEFYTKLRMISMTGKCARGSANFDATAILAEVVPQHFPTSIARSGEAVDWESGPVPDWSGPQDDDELLSRALKSKSNASHFNGRACFADLWGADEDVLAVTYPDKKDRPFDCSAADAALLQHLAFWTGKDPGRMKRLFERSELVRDKWLEREEYQEWSVNHALTVCENVYKGKGDKGGPPIPEDPVIAAPVMDAPLASAVLRSGYQYLSPDQQIDHFKGCVYVRDLDAVYTPDGALLEASKFRATYGGYVFALDAIADKTTKNAWEIFTESQAVTFPKAHGVCFRAEAGPGEILEEEGRLIMNTYTPIQTPSIVGDSTQFTDHLAKLLPVKRDQEILLAYMAAVVQYKCVKFAWTPVVQGMEGNGKTLLIKCLMAAVGKRHTHVPSARDLSNKFNEWLFGKIFIAVEEVYVQDKMDLIESLKEMITNEDVQRQGKGADQIMGGNRANFFMCSNHRDMLRKTGTDRRYAIFYTAQQETGDMERDGMDGDYFPKIYKWLKEEGGWAIVTNFLENYEIPADLNPTGACHTAPATSSTVEAIAMSLGPLEQEILEAIAEGRWGFNGGYVSSMCIDLLIFDKKLPKVPQKKRRAMMRTLGYDLHPNLPDGRLPVATSGDGGRPRIYTKLGSAAEKIKNTREIAAAYIAAQTPEHAPVSEMEALQP